MSFIVFSVFSKISGTLGRIRLLGVQNSPDFQENLVDFSWRDGLLEEGWAIIRIVIF